MSQQLSLFRVELVKLLPVHRYSVNIFSYSGPSGILVLGGIRIVALSISSHEQTQYNRVCCFLIK